LKPENRGITMAKDIFNPTFAHGVAIDAIIGEAKVWL